MNSAQTTKLKAITSKHLKCVIGVSDEVSEASGVQAGAQHGESLLELQPPGYQHQGGLQFLPLGLRLVSSVCVMPQSTPCICNVVYWRIKVRTISSPPVISSVLPVSADGGWWWCCFPLDMSSVAATLAPHTSL